MISLMCQNLSTRIIKTITFTSYIMAVHNVCIKIHLILNVVGYIVSSKFIYVINALLLGVNNVCQDGRFDRPFS